MNNSPSDNYDLIIHEKDVIFPTMVNRDLVLKYLNISQPSHRKRKS